MTDAPALDDLLAGRWRRPDGSPGAPLPLQLVAIAPSLDGREAELIASLGLGRRLAVVADPNTWEALGRRVAQALAAIGLLRDLHRPPPHRLIATASA